MYRSCNLTTFGEWAREIQLCSPDHLPPGHVCWLCTSLKKNHQAYCIIHSICKQAYCMVWLNFYCMYVPLVKSASCITWKPMVVKIAFLCTDVDSACICVTFMSNIQLGLLLDLYVAGNHSPPFVNGVNLTASVTSQEQLKEGKRRLLCPWILWPQLERVFTEEKGQIVYTHEQIIYAAYLSLQYLYH